MSNKERIQKRMASKEFPWDPMTQFKICLTSLEEDVDLCNAVAAIAHTGCAYGNAEAAFYENMVDEDEMISLKEKATELRHNFKSKCKCQPI